MATYSVYHIGRPEIEDMHSRIRQQRAADWLLSTGRSKVLEIGSGVNPLIGCDGVTTSSLALLTVEPDETFAAIWNELAQKMPGETRKRYGVANCTFESLDNAQVSEFLRGSADAIVVNSLLHEVEDEVAFVRKVSELAAPGTLLFANVPNADSMHRQIFDLLDKAPVPSSRAQDKPVPSRSFTVQSLTKLVEGFGWRRENLKTIGVRFFSMSQMESIYAAGIRGLPDLEKLLSLAIDETWGSEIEAIFSRA